MPATNEQVLTAVLQLRDEMSAGMKKAVDATKQFSEATTGLRSALSGLGTLLAGLGIVEFAKSIIETADHLETLSKETGVSTTNLQKIGAAAKAAGSNIDEMAIGLRTLSQHAKAAAEGNDQARALFSGLGISVRDTNGHLKDAQELLGEVADVIKDTESPTLKMAIAQETLGRAGMKLIPVLSEGKEGLYAMGDATEQVGGIMNEKGVKALAAFGNQLVALKDIFKAVIGNWMADLNITVPRIIDYFTQFVAIVQRTMGGWKIIFNAALEDVKFFGTAVKIWFDAIVDTISIAISKMIAPFAKLAAILSDKMGGFLSSDTKNFLQGFSEGLSEIATKSLGDPMADALKKTDQAWATTTNNIAKYNEDIGKSTEDKIGLTIGKMELLKAAIGGVNAEAAKSGDIASKAMDEIIAMGSDSGGRGGRGGSGAAKITDAQRELNMKIAQMQTKARDFTESTGIQLTTQQLQALANAAEQGDVSVKKLLETIKKDTEGDPFKGMELALYDLTQRTFSFRSAWDTVFKDLQTNFSDMFAKAIDGTQKFSDGFKKAMKSLKTDLIKMFTDFATQSLFQSAGGGLLAMLGLGGTAAAAPGTTNAQATSAAGIPAAGGGLGSLMGGAVTSLTTSLGGEGLGTAGLGAVAGLGAAGAGLLSSGLSGNVNVTQSTAGGALAGASAGALIGSVIPGVGTLIGGAVGAIVGGLSAYFGSSRKKRRQQREAAARAAAALAAYQAALAKARGVIKTDIRNKMGGGLATEDAASDYGKLLSGDLSADEIAAFGDPNQIAAQASAVNRQTNVNAPITVNATVNGSYDVAILAQELSYHLQNQMSGAAGVP